MNATTQVSRSTATRSQVLDAARNLLVRVYEELDTQWRRFIEHNEEVDDRVSNATGKVEAALADFDAVRFSENHRYDLPDMASAILCHQYRDDAQRGGSYIPDCNKDHWGNLAARAMLAAATLVETAPEV